MKTFIIVYACIAVAGSVLNAVCSYFRNRSRFCRIAVSVIYVLTLMGILFAMSMLEGKYGMKVLHSTVLAALVLAMVCLGEYAGKRLSYRNGEED